MSDRVKIRDAMTGDIEIVTPDDTLRTAARLMADLKPEAGAKSMAREKSAELAMPERSFGGQFGAGSQKQLKPSTLCGDIAQKHWVLTFAFARHSIGYSR